MVRDYGCKVLTYSLLKQRRLQTTSVNRRGSFTWVESVPEWDHDHEHV